jgi:flagellar biogenesis protein FliO
MARMPLPRYPLALICLLSGPLLAQGVEPAQVRPAAYQDTSRDGQPAVSPSGSGSASASEAQRNAATAHREGGNREGGNREVGNREAHTPAPRLVSPAGAALPRSTGPLITTLASLALVVGAFLLVMWFVRRHLPRGAGPLPSDVLEVLGRASIGPKQPVSLVRLGDRLLLVAIHVGSAETLAEVTDPDEVTRLVGICQQARPGSASGAFRQVFQQMSKPPRAGKAEDRHA